MLTGRAEPTGVLAHDLLILLLRDLGFAEIEIVLDLNLMTRFQISRSTFVRIRCAHHEIAGGDAHKFQLLATTEIQSNLFAAQCFSSRR